MTSTIIAGLLPLFLEWLLPIIGTAIGALLTWVLAQVSRRTGLDIEARHRDSLQTALTNAAALLIQRVLERGENVPGDAPHPSGSVDPKVAEAVNYVERAAPDAIRFFGISTESIMQKIMAQVGRLGGS